MTATATESRERLQVAIVGHVDHGKSTVLGRLLHDTNQVPGDRMEKVKRLCDEQGKQMEYAFLLDALEEEQRQGITIDVSQFFWNAGKRQVAFIDAPGHKEFLKNMVSGASTVDAALLVIDAKEGVSEQSRRHGFILHFLGVEQVIVVVNKMDLVDYDLTTFDAIKAEYSAFLDTIGVHAKHFIPVSGLQGENIATHSENMTWYQHDPLAKVLETLELRRREDKELRFAIQDVYKYDERRILAGRIEAGSVSIGDDLVFMPSKKRGTVRSIERWSVPEAPTNAVAGESIGITLTEQIFVERGEIAGRRDETPKLATRVKANVYWLGNNPLTSGHAYRLKLCTQNVDCIVDDIVCVLDTATLDRSHAEEVTKNQVGEIIFSLRQPLAFDNFSEIKYTGRFVIADGEDVVGGGIVDDANYPDMVKIIGSSPVSQNIFMSEASVSRDERASKLGHQGAVVWLTGLSGSGKTTLARGLSRALFDQGVNAYVLDGDNLRHGLNSDLGFSPDDRAENMRRVAEVAKLMQESGVVVISALISPYRASREFARSLVPERFVEVFVDAPLETCMERDVKGLYAKAKAENIPNFTGVTAPYEAPTSPEIHVKTNELDERQSLNVILKGLGSLGFDLREIDA